METNTRKIKRRLVREGWVLDGGKRHDKFKHPDHPEKVIVVPRHRDVSPGVAEDIAKQAGWQ